MTGRLHQISMRYEPVEDRLLLRIGTSEQLEYQLLLSRRFVKVLWGALMKTLEHYPDVKADLAPAVKNAVLAMQHQEAVQASEFEVPYAKDNRNLMSNTGPQLIVGGKVTVDKKNIAAVTLRTKDGTDIRFTLNKQLLHALCHLIVSTAARAEWDLNLTVGDGNVVVPEKRAHLH